MAMGNKILVAVDVDGTLLNTEFDDVLPRREIQAMESVRKAGHLLAICTGRNTRSLNSLFELSNWQPVDLPRILLNGALIWGGNPQRVLAQHLLSADEVRRLVALFQEHGAVPMVYGTDEDGGLLYHQESPTNPIQSRYLKMRSNTVGAIKIEQDMSSLPLEYALEVGTIDEEARIAALTKAIENQLAGVVRVINTRSLLGGGAYFWAEAFHRECNKGSALRTLTAALDEKPGKIIAIGDNFNDLDMFEEADFSVAMGNSPDQVKDRADMVTDSVNEGGAARIMELIARGEFPPIG
ncbi:MAG: HAD family hydrolase [Gemmatimonadales bacterium]|nr:HAD family hydrolase [Gemmatimonadales bacterium]